MGYFKYTAAVSFSLIFNTFAYVSCDDVHNVSEFEGQNVVAIKAPRHTRLEVADSQDVSTLVPNLDLSTSNAPTVDSTD